VFDVLFWVYLVNAVLLINHEIDSAYWREWRLFKLPGGISFFLILHFFILFIVLLGLIQVFQESLVGLWLSLVLALGGIFAFSIHMYFLKMGRDEFKLPVSLFILISLLPVSLVQLGITVYLLVI
jgi:hypothetical protein